MNLIEELSERENGKYIEGEPFEAYLTDGKIIEQLHTCTLSYNDLEIHVHGYYHKGMHLGVQTGNQHEKPPYSITVIPESKLDFRIYPRDKIGKFINSIFSGNLLNIEKAYYFSSSIHSNKLKHNDTVCRILNSIPILIFTETSEKMNKLRVESQKRYLNYQELLNLVDLTKSILDAFKSPATSSQQINK
jgi:hypothetical protein